MLTLERERKLLDGPHRFGDVVNAEVLEDDEAILGCGS